MRNNRSSDDIRTPRIGAMIGKRVMSGQEAVAEVMVGNKVDTLSVQEFAAALYGEGTRCVVIPADGNIFLE